MTCHIPKWPVAAPTVALGGKTWSAAVETLKKLTDSYPLALLIGRAGMGKTQVALEVCRRVNCIYIDLTELGEKNISTVAAVAAWRIIRHKISTLEKSKNRLVEVYRKHGYEGVLSIARVDPLWTLQTALALLENKPVIILDELIPSAEDPNFFELAYILHRIRNMNLQNASFIVTMLPDVYEKIVEKIPPLGNFFTYITVQLPDVVPEEELAEIIATYCPEKIEIARKILAERPDATIREILLELNNTPTRKYVELLID